MPIEKEGPFIRVYRLPSKLTNGYCFDGGKPIEFLNVDWFGTTGHVEIKRYELEPWLRKKAWAKVPGRYLVLSDEHSPELTWVFVVTSEDRPHAD